MSTTIVVGYDAEEPAQRALERAIEEAKATGSRLLIVVVDEALVEPFDAPTFGSGPITPPSLEPFVEPPELKPLTDEAMRRAEAAGVVAEYVWAGGDPAQAIIDAARDNSASAIVVGSHHHTLLGRALGLDVAAAVKREADCEVIVAGSQE
jgi:nucleotide-binding universal stress UspA family protein